MTTIKKKSQKQEKQVAKDLGGKLLPASGAMWSAKGDARSDKYLVECKITEKTYYSLTTKVWEKIRNEALKDGLRTPVMNVQLRDGVNSIAILEWNDFIVLPKAREESSIFVGNPIPEMIEAKSYRITPDFLYQDIPNNSGKCFVRHDFKFIDVDKNSPIVTNRHLVMLDWEDFLIISNEWEKHEV